MFTFDALNSTEIVNSLRQFAFEQLLLILTVAQYCTCKCWLVVIFLNTFTLANPMCCCQFQKAMHFQQN